MAGRRSISAALTAVLIGGLLATVPGLTAGSARAGAAPPVIDAPAPLAASPTIELGRTAVNGAVHAAVLDPATGRTYIGGVFSEVGRRTGPLSVVEPPEVGDGAVAAGAPEVAGAVTAVFADDRPNDPGFFVVGRLTAINGTAVPPRPIHRLHLVDGRWILDSSWVAEDGCHTGNGAFPEQAIWIATPTYLIAGGYAANSPQYQQATGLTLIARADGDRLTLGQSSCDGADVLHPSIGMLPSLTDCAELIYCVGAVGAMAYDPTSGRLLTLMRITIGPADAIDHWEELVAYDLRPATAARAWSRLTITGDPPGDPGRHGFTRAISALPDSFLAHGTYRLDEDDAVTATLELDVETGSIVRRWGPAGVLDPETGESLGEASPCFTDEWDPWAVPARAGSSSVGWIHGGRLCRFDIGGAGVEATLIGSYDPSDDAAVRRPIVPYTTPGGTQLLLGSTGAIELDSGDVVDWDPAPGVFEDQPGPPWVAASTGGIILGGAFSFLRGQPALGVAALDTAMSPIPTFQSGLQAESGDTVVRALALTDGRLIVGGERLLGNDGPSVTALRASDGAVDGWSGHPDAPTPVASIVVDGTGSFWIAGTSLPTAPTTAIQRYAAFDAGGGLLQSPSMGCLEAPTIPGHWPSQPICDPVWQDRVHVGALLSMPDGSLYLAGSFGSVEGTPRNGLARIAPDGTVAPFDPDLLAELRIEPEGGLYELEPHGMLVLSDRLVVVGRFSSILAAASGGGGHIVRRSPVFVFDAASGDLILPATEARDPWFPIGGVFATGHDVAHTDSGLFVAFGRDGIGVLDATTLEFDAEASAPLLNPDWWSQNESNAVYTLALAGGGGTAADPDSLGGASTAGTGLAATTESRTGRMILGGSFDRWQDRVAGNVARAILVADTIAPTASMPKVTIRSDKAVGGTAIAARVDWVGGDPGGSGVARYDLHVSVDGGAYTTVSGSLRRPTSLVDLTRGRTYKYRVRASDHAGNRSAWVYGVTQSLSLVQETSAAITYSSGWTSQSGATFSGGTTRSRGTAGASATYTFTGRGVALVATTGPTRGRARLYVNGTLVDTIDLGRGQSRHRRPAYRQIVWQRHWSSSAQRTVRIELVGTSGRPLVDIDAFVVVK
jgi:hypothetical protein